MLAEYSLPKYFWVEAVNIACYVLNRVNVRAKLDKTPYEILKGRTPNLSHLHIFGCKVFIHNNGKSHLGQFYPKSDEGGFLGYSSVGKSFRVFNKWILVVEETTHIVFDKSDPSKSKVEDEDEVGEITIGVKNLEKKVVPQNTEGVGEITQGVENIDLEERVEPTHTLPRDLRYSLSHPKELILGDPSERVRTRKGLRKEVNHYAFNSMSEPININQSLSDEYWILAMGIYMGLPWYRVHTVVLNDPGRLLSVHIMHTALVSGWAGSMALYELEVFDPSDPVLDPMWRQGMFVIPFMTRLGITNSWGGWSISGGTITNPGIWSYEGIYGLGIWVYDPYGLTGNVQSINPSWGAEGFDPFVQGGIASHHISVAFVVAGTMWYGSTTTPIELFCCTRYQWDQGYFQSRAQLTRETLRLGSEQKKEEIVAVKANNMDTDSFRMPGHIKADYPTLKDHPIKEKGKEKPKYMKDKQLQKAFWIDSASDSSETETEEKKINMFLMGDHLDYMRVSTCKSGKDIWDRLCITYEGTNEVKQSRLNILLHDYELFRMKPNESISDMYIRFTQIVTSLHALESKDLNIYSIDNLLGSLITYEQGVSQRKIDAGEPRKEKNIALKVEDSESEHSQPEDEDDIALMTRQFRSFLKRKQKRRQQWNRDKFNRNGKVSNEVICYECRKPGHIKTDCLKLKTTPSKEKVEEKPMVKKGKKKFQRAFWTDSASDSFETKTEEEVTKPLLDGR
ncbi:hypothetical protein KFK09_009453 [Dendrobium nobile]|uniref:CCHC-type domain-containing protein n=1 Tax=Dendrobium nobile TaxID=94219 RepID=A0A8T3BJE6_DENNO|nr:hypothetical protein KFK09_009453 [Dendrobium nobile]